MYKKAWSERRCTGAVSPWGKFAFKEQCRTLNKIPVHTSSGNAWCIPHGMVREWWRWSHAVVIRQAVWISCADLLQASIFSITCPPEQSGQGVKAKHAGRSIHVRCLWYGKTMELKGLLYLLLLTYLTTEFTAFTLRLLTLWIRRITLWLYCILEPLFFIQQRTC